MFETQHAISILVQLQLDAGTADTLKFIAGLFCPQKKVVIEPTKGAPKVEEAPQAEPEKPEEPEVAKVAKVAKVAESTPAEPAKKTETKVLEPAGTAEKPDDKPSKADLPRIRKSVMAYVEANPADGKQKVKEWLDQHGYKGVSAIERKDWAAFNKFLLGIEEEAKNA